MAHSTKAAEMVSDFNSKAHPDQQGQVPTSTNQSDVELPEHSYGLKEYACPKNALADVVFVHDLGGHREKTGVESKSLAKILPDSIEHVRILTFGYASNLADWKLILARRQMVEPSRLLLDGITNYRYDDTATRPIIFVAHGFGGLICQDALLRSKASPDPRAQALLESTRGVILFGTPVDGATLAKWAEMLGPSFGLTGQPNTWVMEVLKRDYEALARVQQNFSTMIRDRAKHGEPVPNFVTCSTQLPGKGDDVSVEKESKGESFEFLLSNDIYPFHMDMSKFGLEDDPGFLAVNAVLQKWLEDLDAVEGPFEFINMKDLQLPRLLDSPGESTFSSRKTARIPNFLKDRNPKFIEFEKTLADLEDRLEVEHIVALAGIGGAGKSEIATEYCYQFWHKNPGAQIFWIPMDSRTASKLAYTKIAKQLGLQGWGGSKVNKLHLIEDRIVQNNAGPWLIVFDNADDMKALMTYFARPQEKEGEGFTDCIPRLHAGHVIVTTRENHVGQALMGGHSPVVISRLPPSDGTILLYSILSPEGEVDHHSVRLVLEILGHLPLAITQAAAYMKWNNISVAKYLAELTRSDEALLKFLSNDRIKSWAHFDSAIFVARSWKLSFDKILKENPRSAELLNIMAHLDCQNIPRFVLREESESQEQLTSVLGVLQELSLITADNNLETYSMHRLVQLVIRTWAVFQGKKVLYRRAALEMIALHFPSAQSEDQELQQSLFPHASVVQSYTFYDQKTCAVQAKLQYLMAWHEVQWGHYNVAESYCSKAYQKHQIILGTNSIDSLHTVSLLAVIWRHQGHFSKAEVQQEQILKQKESLLGLDDLDTIETVSDLADILERRGKFKEAEVFTRRALAVRSKSLGPDHRDTISSVMNLAIIRRRQGVYQEAKALARQTLKENQKLLGSNHANTLTNMYVLAGILRELGEYKEAAQISKTVRTGRKELLGEDHPDTVNSINNLALMHRLRGNYELAENLHRRVLSAFQSLIGKDSPQALNASQNLSVVLQDQGKLQEAEAVSRHVLEGRTAALGEHHPWTLETTHQLSSILDKAGYYAEAETLATRALEGRRAILGTTHPHTLDTLSALASIKQHTGETSTAETLFREAIQLRNQILPPDHPATLSCLYHLGILLQDQEKWDESQACFLESWKGSRVRLGDEHPETVRREEMVMGVWV